MTAIEQNNIQSWPTIDFENVRVKSTIHFKDGKPLTILALSKAASVKVIDNLIHVMYINKNGNPIFYIFSGLFRYTYYSEKLSQTSEFGHEFVPVPEVYYKDLRVYSTSIVEDNKRKLIFALSEFNGISIVEDDKVGSVKLLRIKVDKVDRTYDIPMINLDIQYTQVCYKEN